MPEINYKSGHYLGLKLTKTQHQRLEDIAMELVDWWPKESYPLSKEEVFSLLITLGYHMERPFAKDLL